MLGTSSRGLVLAVSGGPDSICLMQLAAAYRADLPPLTVAVVDHGLRDGSAGEAGFVLDQARSLGLPAHGLAWEGPKPARAIQERARTARYALLDALCRTVGASHVLTGHTLDDQAETVLFRMARGSGIGGLAGMRAATDRSNLAHLRPLLSFPKARLLATCEAKGWPFIADPSNRDPRFARARWRDLMPSLAAEGLDAARLARLADRAARAEAALARGASDLEARASRGPGTLDFDQLAPEPFELVIRVLGAGVGRVGPAVPRLDRLERLAADLLDAGVDGRPLRRTLGGALVTLSRSGLVTLTPEPPRRRGAGVASSPARRAAAGLGAAPLQGDEGRLH